MKKIGIGLVITWLVGLFLTNVQAGDFRRATWGMTPDQVRKIEARATEVGSPSPAELLYQGTLMDKFKVIIGYHFENGRLVRGSYGFPGTLKPSAFDIFQQLLTRKYGQPESLVARDVFGQSEATWRTKETEIDLLGQSGGRSATNPSAGARGDQGVLGSLQINYYSLAAGERDAKAYRKEVKQDRETDAVIKDTIRDWIQVSPDEWVWEDL